MMKQWEDGSKEDKNPIVGKMEGKSLQAEGVQVVPELLVPQVLTKERSQIRR